MQCLAGGQEVQVVCRPCPSAAVEHVIVQQPLRQGAPVLQLLLSAARMQMGVGRDVHPSGDVPVLVTPYPDGPAAVYRQGRRGRPSVRETDMEQAIPYGQAEPVPERG